MTTYITQEQALALAHARNPVDMNERWVGFNIDELHAFSNAAIQHYRDSLVAGVVLPEPFKKQGQQLSHDGCDVCFCDLWEAGQLRQAIADALVKPQDHLQDIAAFIGVGGYNGATSEQTVERIKAEFQRLNDALATQVPQHETRKLIEQCRDALAEELSAWDIDPPLAHVEEAHDNCVSWLASAPGPKEGA